MKRFLYLWPLLVLAACTAAPPPSKGSPTRQSNAQLLGLVEVTISTEGQLSDIQLLKDSLNSQAAVNLLSNFTFTPTSGPTALNDTSRSRRFITTAYNVTNKSSSAVNNLMLVAVNRPNNLGGTAFSAITLNDGTKISDANLARSILPSHGMQDSAGTIQVNPSLASMQVIPTSLANSLTTDGRASGMIASTNTVLDYAFNVRKVGNTPGTLGAGQTGTMALAFSAPLASSQVKSVSLTFAVVTDDTLTFTENLEQQSATEAQLDAALLTQTNRTAVEFRKLPGSTRANTINGVTYPTASYPSARTALSVSGFARELSLTRAPQGVELTSSSLSVMAGENIMLTATLEQSYAPISSVTFKKDGVSVGTDSTAPYTVDVALSSADNGTRNFTAEVTDVLGNAVTSNTAAVSVTPPEGDLIPADQITAEIDSSITPPMAFAGGEVEFSGAGSVGNDLTYHWDFGDGTSMDSDLNTSGDASHTYEIPGYYIAKLTVTDTPTNAIKTQEFKIAVLPDVHDMPTARAVAYGQSVMFDARYPVEGFAYEWLFPDGTKVTDSSVVHTFETPGFQDVELTIYDKRSGVDIGGTPVIFERRQTRINNIVQAPRALISGAKIAGAAFRFTGNSYSLILMLLLLMSGTLATAQRL